jgi:coenzyme F420-reducing hydrogenase beta subunit
MTGAIAPRDMVRAGLCIGCGGCVAQAPAGDAAMDLDAAGRMRPRGAPAWYRGKSDTLLRTCPFSPAATNEDEIAAAQFPHAPHADAALGRFEAAYVGHVAEARYRLDGSSGGMVTWVAAELMRRGLVDAVAHVVASDDPQRDGRHFRYTLSRDAGALRAGAKSRYYPVEMSQVLSTILAEPGRYAVVGIPCFIKAVHLLRREHPVLRDRIRHTLGLFCGHMKSARFVESLAWQLGVAPADVERVEFRRKLPERPANWYNAALTTRTGEVASQDWWHLADGDWGAGFFMDEACNWCDDVMAETADVSFGDAWVEPYSSDWQGTNVVVVRSRDIAGMIAGAIDDGRLQLTPVDAAFVAQTQAAGLRQRREGLAWRLARRRHRLMPRKRVAPDAHAPTPRRRAIYAMRKAISTWSHRVSGLAGRIGMPALYVRWARAAAAVYHAFAYHRGRLGQLVSRFGPR